MAVKQLFVTAIPVGKSTPHGMADRFELKELTELCDPTGLVDSVLFELFLRGGDITGYTQEQQDAVQEAMKVLCRACHDADSLVESYLYSAQAGYEQITEHMPMIINLACDIARFNLYDTQYTEVVLYRYEQALKMLKQIADGFLKLPIDEIPEQDKPSGVYVYSNTPEFSTALY